MAKTTPTQENLGFQGHPDWNHYIRHRPSYPPTFFNRLYEEHAKNLNSFGTVNDQGSGAGIAAEILANKFKKVIVSEPNAEYVKIAENRLTSLGKFPKDKFTFLQEACEKSSLPDASVDCLTVCEALHWADIENSVKEFARILKPGGTLGIFHYSPPHLEDDSMNEIWSAMHAASAEKYQEQEGVFTRAWHNMCNGYQNIYFDPKLWKEGTRRTHINTRGDVSKMQPYVKDPEVKRILEEHKSVPPENNVAETDVVEWVEGDEDWQAEVDAEWLKSWMRNVAIGRAEQHHAEINRKIDELIGNEKVKIFYPVVQVIATRR